jgi:hypothetical protein
MTQNSINTSNVLLQSVSTSTAAVINCSTTIPDDNTIPQQSTEGTAVLSLSITPNSTTTILEILFSSIGTKDGTGDASQTALFQDSTENAIAATDYDVNAARSNTCYLRHIITSGTTSSTTFKIKVGCGVGTFYINGDTSGGRLMGGVSNTCLVINEYLV